jgi:hypothetical protein
MDTEDRTTHVLVRRGFGRGGVIDSPECSLSALHAMRRPSSTAAAQVLWVIPAGSVWRMLNDAYFIV